jgi:hypothetical protein
MSGAELRALPTPPIDAEVDVFQVSAPEDADDVRVADDQVVDLESGATFFTSPARIMAGRTLVPRSKVPWPQTRVRRTCA